MKLKSLLWAATKDTFGIPLAIFAIIVSLLSPWLSYTLSVYINILISVAIFFLSALITLTNALTKAVKLSQIPSAEIIHCVKDGGGIIFFAEENEHFQLNSLVTLYRRVAYNGNKYYEQEFCVGEVQNVQDDGLIQITFIASIKSTQQDLDAAATNGEVVKNLFVRSIVSRAYLQSAQVTGGPGHA